MIAMLMFLSDAVPVAAPPEVANQLSFGVIAVWLLQEMKKSNLPMFAWVKSSSDRINQFLSALSAILVTGGVHFTYHQDGDQLIITGLMASFMHYTAAFIQQGAWQEMVYRLAFKLPADLMTTRVTPSTTITIPVVKAEETKVNP